MEENNNKDPEKIKNAIKDSSLPPPHPKKLKYLTTAAILLGNIAFGSSFNFYAPALDSIRVKYGTTVDDISIVFTIMLISYCFGALTCTFIYKYLFSRQFWVTFCLGVMGVALIVTPHAGTKTLYYIIGAFLGFAVGTYDASQIVWMVELWQDKAGPWIQAQHFCYAIGSNFPPLVSGPFLIEVDDEDENVTKTTTIDPDELDKLYIPFTIGGCLPLAAFVFQALLFVFCRYYTPPMYVDETATVDVGNEKKPDNASSTGGKILNYLKSKRGKLVIITGAFLGAYQGMEMTTFQFIPTFGQYSDINLSESKSAYLLTGLTGAFAVGRFIGIFVILKVNPVALLVINLIFVLAGNIVLLIWAGGNVTLFWVACITIGLGFSTIYATFSAFIEKHLVFTDSIGSVMIVCGSAIAAIYPIIVGNGVENNPTILTYVSFFSILICGISLWAGWWVSKDGKEGRT